MTTAGGDLRIADAQRDVREAYLNGAAGQLVAGAVWLVSAALATTSGARAGIVVLAIGGCFIFPLSVLALKLAGKRGSLPAGHPMNGLAMQVAFTVPLAAPLVAAAALHRLEWFYPAAALVVGAHYLPFVFLYGMRQYAVLSALLMMGGLAIGLYVPGSFATAGWMGGAVLWLFAAWIFPRRAPAAMEKEKR